jgi:hypothetical protein
MTNGKICNLSKALGFPFVEQIKFLANQNQTLFISTSRSIYLCENPLNILINKSVSIRPIDLSFRNIHDILIKDSMIYISSDDGLTIIPLSEIHNISANTPIPYFQDITINDKIDGSQIPGISIMGWNRFYFGFGSVNYSFSPVVYSYMLEGFDEHWVEGTGTNVTYQSLPKGDYSFRLRVRKSTSEWSEPVSFGISIKATIWQHPVFFIMLTVVLAGMTLLIFLWRKNAELKRSEVEHQLVLLEQKALQSMMNPHFIFNSLGSIQNYLLQGKAAEAGLYLSQFARLIRQNLNAINSEMVNLEEETDRLKNYLDLEKKRMENKFDYHLEIDKSVESEDIQIPSMIVQPFVENSIWHGIANLDGKGIIHILFRFNDEKSMEIIVEDNGIGILNAEKFIAKGEKHLNMGMQLTRKRLELLGKKYHVETRIDTSEISPGSLNPGTKVVLIVPFI